MLRTILRTALLLLLTHYGSAALATSDNHVHSFEAELFAKYAVEVRLDPPNRTMQVRGEVTIPAALRTGPSLTIALTEAAPGPQLHLLSGGKAVPVTATLVNDAAVPKELRRWRIALPGTNMPDEPLILSFSYRTGQSNSTIFAITPEVAFAGGTATAWYPQLVDAAGIRMLGTGIISFDAPKDFTIVGAEGGVCSSPRPGTWISSQPLSGWCRREAAV
jgi:hypothetical protein